MNLTIKSRRVGDTVVVKCSGRVVAGDEAQSLHSHVRNLFDEGNEIVLHLGEVSFVDSSGMGTIMRLLANARGKGGDLKLCAVGGLVQKTLQLTNLLSVLEIYESEEQAIAAFYARGRALKTESDDGKPRVLCVDDSIDVLAYLREVLRGAGYKPLTTANLHDALILMRAAKVDLVVLGNKFSSDSNQSLFKKVNTSVPMIPLEDEFCRQDATQAGQAVVDRVRASLKR